MEPVRIGVVGCGNISRVYLENLTRRFDSTRVAAVSSRTLAQAETAAAKYGVPRAESTEDLLRDPEVELVVNLTPPAAHCAITARALEAGKHVYSEKPLAMTADEAQRLVSLARENHVLLGCAPDIFLGQAQQAARRALDAGVLGRVRSAGAFFLNHGCESWHPNPDNYYRAGGGPVFDMGPYYLTALVSLLGPVRRAAGLCSQGAGQRVIGRGPRAGETIPVEVPTHVGALLEFESGVNCTAIFSYDCWGSALPHLQLQGDLGTMVLPDPNLFGGEVLVQAAGADRFTSLTGPTDSYNARGTGIADLARAIRQGTVPRTDACLAAHVVEIMEAIQTSGETGQFVPLRTSCRRPDPLPGAEEDSNEGDI